MPLSARTRTVRFLSCFAFAWSAQGALVAAQPSPPPAVSTSPDPVRRLLDEGQTLLRANQFEKAVAPIYAAIEELRRRGRETTPDMGVTNLLLARALAGFDHAQANDAYAGAVNLLAGGRDLRPYSEANAEYLARLESTRLAGRAEALIEAWLDRIMRPGVPDVLRGFAIAQAESYFTRAGRAEDAQRILTRALTLEATTPELSRLRGVARFFRALETAPADGEKAFAELDESIADLRRAGASGSGDLGVALHTRGLLLVNAGLYETTRYENALDFLAEATPFLEAAERHEYNGNVALRLRLLNFLNLNKQGVALARSHLDRTRARHGAQARETRLARLEFVKMAAAGEFDDPEIEAIGNAEFAALDAEAKEASARGEPGVWRDPGVAALAGEILAQISLKARNFQQAVYYAEHAIALHQLATPENPAAPITAMRHFSEAARGTGVPDLVERTFSELVATTERVFGRDHVETAHDLGNFASALAEAGRSAEAVPLLRRVIAIYERAFSANRDRVALPAQNLAVILNMLGRHEEAEKLFARALDLLVNEEAKLADRALVTVNRAESLVLLDRPDEALEMLDAAQPLLDRAKTQHPPIEFTARAVRIRALIHLDRLAEARDMGFIALAEAKPRLDEEARTVALTYVLVAHSAGQTGLHSIALRLARKARELEEAFSLNNRTLTRDIALGLVTAALDLAGE